MPNAVLPNRVATKGAKATNVIAGASVVLLLFFYFLSTKTSQTLLLHPKLQMFKMLFVSILIEALPFILVGVILSAIVEVFVSEQMLKKLIPANPVLGISTVLLLGLIFPVCECGMVPAVRRFIQKGMPVYAAMTFLIAGPILNPIVMWSTYTAFRSKPELTFARMGLAVGAAFVIGGIIYYVVKTNPLKASQTVPPHSASGHHHGHIESTWNKLVRVMSHSIEEFFEMGKFLIFGAILVGLLQTFIPKDSLVELGHTQGSAHLFMMLLGFILSLCSTSDAFVAQSFSASFSPGALLAFVVLGPMLNLKGLWMMSAVFTSRFVLLYSVLTAGFVLLGTWLVEKVFLS